MSTPVVLGSNREFWLADLGDAVATYSFLEDAVGTSVTTGQVSRARRMGDPINTGPNSTWHQLSWQGGAQQEIWNDPQMFQKGNLDVITWTGKAKMWPGFQSWFKNEGGAGCCGMIMTPGTLATTPGADFRRTPLYFAEADRGPWEARPPGYSMYALTPGYARGDSRAVQAIYRQPQPFRGLYSVMSDNFAANFMIVTTSTHMYMLNESSGIVGAIVLEDTGAPLTGTQGYEYSQNTGVGFQDGFFYAHGNRLMKRVGLPPYGVVGTHTVVKNFMTAKSIRGMTVWNNRVYFGVQYPSGAASIFVSDGATTVKAFDFPHTFVISRIVTVAGSLYINGMQFTGLGNQPGATGTPNLIQQVWRYDGVSLKKLWQEGHFDDGANHWFSDLCVYEGMVVWGSQGTATSGNQTGVFKNNFACLMFYDPVADAIVPGPGLGVDAANTNGLWITALANWNSTIALTMKDETNYGTALNGPYMVATMRGEDQVRHDFRWPMAGDVVQFQDPGSQNRVLSLFTSEYHGDDDVANVKKCWLSLKLRVKFTGSHAKLDILIRNGIDAATTYTVSTALTDDGSHDWQDIVVPLKTDGTHYFISRKLQIQFQVYNTDTGVNDSTDQCWIDDMAVQYTLAPTKIRQWQIRIPLSNAQLRLDGSANTMTTSALLQAQTENMFFVGSPIKFWPPTSTPGVPSAGGYVEAIITDWRASQSRLESTDTQAVGSVAMTVVENVTNQ